MLSQNVPGFSRVFASTCDAMPKGIRDHIRVPEDLFNIQVQIYATYHMSDPKVFFTREDVWDVPTAQTRR